MKRAFLKMVFPFILFQSLVFSAICAENTEIVNKLRWITGTNSTVFQIMSYIKVPALIPRGILLRKYKAFPFAGGFITQGCHDEANINSLSGNHPHIAGIKDTLSVSRDFGRPINLTELSSLVYSNFTRLMEDVKIYIHPSKKFFDLEFYEFNYMGFETLLRLFRTINLSDKNKDILYSEMLALFLDKLPKKSSGFSSDEVTYYYRGNYHPEKFILEDLNDNAVKIDPEFKSKLEKKPFPLIFGSTNLEKIRLHRNGICEYELLAQGELALGKEIDTIIINERDREELEGYLTTFNLLNNINIITVENLHEIIKNKIDDFGIYATQMHKWWMQQTHSSRINNDKVKFFIHNSENHLINGLPCMSLPAKILPIFNDEFWHLFCMLQSSFKLRPIFVRIMLDVSLEDSIYSEKAFLSSKNFASFFSRPKYKEYLQNFLGELEKINEYKLFEHSGFNPSFDIVKFFKDEIENSDILIMICFDSAY